MSIFLKRSEKAHLKPVSDSDMTMFSFSVKFILILEINVSAIKVLEFSSNAYFFLVFLKRDTYFVSLFCVKYCIFFSSFFQKTGNFEVLRF